MVSFSIPGSPWRDKISLAILELQEKGEIQMLYDKWWKSSRDTCSQTGKEKESKANALGVDTIGGIFIVLLGGLAVAVLVSIFEFCYHSKNRNDIENVRTYIYHIFYFISQLIRKKYFFLIFRKMLLYLTSLFLPKWRRSYVSL